MSQEKKDEQTTTNQSDFVAHAHYDEKVQVDDQLGALEGDHSPEFVDKQVARSVATHDYTAGMLTSSSLAGTDFDAQEYAKVKKIEDAVDNTQAEQQVQAQARKANAVEITPSSKSQEAETPAHKADSNVKPLEKDQPSTSKKKADRGGKVNFDDVSPHQLELQKRLPKTIWLICLMAFLTFFSGLANNSFSPAISAIAADFNTSVSHIQQIIAYYTIGMGIGQLFWGPFMDRFGRRIVIIICAFAGVAVNTWLIFAQTFTELQFIRIFQGMVFTGLSISPRVMLRDIFSPRKYILYNSWIVTIFLFAPVVAPVLGGWIYITAGWHMIFISISGLLILAFALFMIFIPETIDPAKVQPFKIKTILSNYCYILTTPNSLFLMLINSLYTITIVSFPTLLPAIYMYDYGISPHLFGYCMLVNLVSIAIGVQINQRLITGGANPALVWRNGAILQALFTVVNFVVCSYFLGVPGIMIALFANLVFNGFLNGNLITIYLLDYSNMVGTANSLLTSSRLIFAGSVVAWISHFDRHKGATLLYTNATIIILCSILIVTYCLIYRPQDRAKKNN
ncbi:hypothetical protein CJP74_02080 [Psittacicella melopsittaci]|uniref:Major facilitator superfamily (MFS) profile domain-containing protein n=1 Tax=Psittacicella melopsittaci TaxID=2028576 RepID=A0A3A1YAZ1_9GAMM|nr:multidrug effflux MFS transporter [Psittacicella melopsittaci]RIY33344.1 hypothetical protein CJP74_02080 [Psittacicella melopsittaci]